MTSARRRLPATRVSSYTYNGVEARVGKTTSSGSNTYRRAGVGVTAPVLGDGAANYTPGISERRGTVTKFAHTDRLARPRGSQMPRRP